ncbi:hypothetical protein M3Y96_00937800 [Aphelenchoides besseyi]|nr:hypothetical protein M3Y96_00937800 [Aphelenchoides besseyi]
MLASNSRREQNQTPPSTKNSITRKLKEDRNSSSQIMQTSNIRSAFPLSSSTKESCTVKIRKTTQLLIGRLMDSLKWNETLRNKIAKVFNHHYLEYTPKVSTWYVIFISLVANLMVILVFHDQFVAFWINNWTKMKVKIGRNSIHKIKRTKLKALYMLLCQSKKLPIVEFPRSGIMWERTPDRQRTNNRPINLRATFIFARLVGCFTVTSTRGCWRNFTIMLTVVTIRNFSKRTFDKIK